MGCCFSSPGEGPNSPYPGAGPPGTGDPSASARPINTTDSSNAQRPGATAGTPTSPTSPTSDAANTQQRRRRRQQQPLSQHINKPLRRHAWSSPSTLSSARRGAAAGANRRRWTRAALDRERADFFDTRVAGRAEVWLALRAALEVLWDAGRHPASPEDDNGGAEDGDGEVDATTTALATAQSILDAGEITLPSGDLAQGAYDALGNYYALPEWIVADPANVVAAADGDGSDEKEFDDDGDDGGVDSGSETEEDDNGTVVIEGEGEARNEKKHDQRRRDEKGKAVALEEEEEERERDLVAVRARLSENGRDVVVRVGRGDHVKVLERRVVEKAKLEPTAKIRIAYLGKILREHSSLIAQGWQEGHTVNALVFHNS